jgi:hypothetical protein
VDGRDKPGHDGSLFGAVPTSRGVRGHASSRLQLIRFDQDFRGHFPRLADLVDHLNGQSALAVQDLVARIHAIVRRSKGHAQSVIQTGDLVVNLDNKTVEVGGQREWRGFCLGGSIRSSGQELKCGPTTILGVMRSSCIVIASQRVRLRRPDDRLREAIQKPRAQDWIASVASLLAMTHFALIC